MAVLFFVSCSCMLLLSTSTSCGVAVLLCFVIVLVCGLVVQVVAGGALGVGARCFALVGVPGFSRTLLLYMLRV